MPQYSPPKTPLSRELLFLGPDENIVPSDIDWLVERATRRGYTMPSAFISSKPRAGINHKVSARRRLWRDHSTLALLLLLLHHHHLLLLLPPLPLARGRSRRHDTAAAASAAAGAQEYGVTSEGVAVFLHEALGAIGISPTEQSWSVHTLTSPPTPCTSQAHAYSTSMTPGPSAVDAVAV